MLLISQGIGDKLNTQERNNSIYILKIQNVLLSEKKKVYCNCEKNSECMLGIGNRLIKS